MKGLADADGGFHHLLLLDVPPSNDRTGLQIQVVKFPGPPTRDIEDEAVEVEK